MFTGLVQGVGEVERVSRGAMTDVWIRSPFTPDSFVHGESIACEGCCLTVVEWKGSSFKVQASPETLRRTTLETWHSGTRVNLERALKAQDAMGGHLVQGHVDGVAAVLEARPEGGSWFMSFSLPPDLAGFFVEKGSVAIDGISLTVNSVTADRFSVVLIPETVAATTLKAKTPGHKVNLEADIIAKYVARQLGPFLPRR